MEKDRNNNNGKPFQNDFSCPEERLKLEDFKGDKNEYISLTEASRYTPYSQEYLSLRARQGKLKAEKIGRDWMTKISWVKDYLKQVNGSNGNGAIKTKKTVINFPYRATLKYSVLVLVFFSVVFFTIFNWQAYQPKIKNNILTINSEVEKNFKNLAKIFKADYNYKTKKIVSGFKNINYKVTNLSEKILSESKYATTLMLGSLEDTFRTSLEETKKISSLTLGSVNNSIDDFSKSFKTTDSNVSYFILARKKNISNFFIQTKEVSIQSARGIVFFTGKNLTLASETILWPGKQLGKTLILTSGSLKTMDDKINHFVLAQKNNAANFFARAKNSFIQTTQNFAQTKKSTTQSLNDAFVFTGKNLTLASETILWPGKQLGKTLILTSNSIRITKDDVGQFVISQKNNITNFFVQTKKNVAQSLDNAFISTGKNLIQVKNNAIKIADDVFVFTGKNLTLASETILWPGKQLGQGLIFTSKILKAAKEEVSQFAIAQKNNIADFSVQTKKNAIQTTKFIAQSFGIVKKSANQKYTSAQGFINEGWLAVRHFAAQSIDEVEISAIKGWRKLSSKLGDGYLALLDYLIPEREFSSYETLTSRKESKDTEVGMVVFPVTGKDEISQNKYLLQEIEESFSDEVTIEKSKDGKVGVIIPTKPAVPGEKYLYMLVPIEISNIKNQNAK